MSFPRPFSFAGYLLASLIIRQIWPAGRIGHERYGISARLAYGLIDPAVKLYGLRPKLRQMALDAIDILGVMSREVGTESGSV